MSVATIEARPNTELTQARITGVESFVEDLQVFNVSLYADLFNRVTSSDYTREDAKNVVRFAAINDGVGVVTENISGAKDKFGNHLFDMETRIRLQMTPLEHLYIQDRDQLTGEALMVCPEHRWGNFKTDILNTISGWRRGIDRQAMVGVRNTFLEQSEVGDVLVWKSGKGEEWEGPQVMKFNGAYGFVYVGEVIKVGEDKALRVHDFKEDLDAQSGVGFLDNLEGETYQNLLYSKRPLLEQIMTTVVKLKQGIKDETVWRKLAAAKVEQVGNDGIFNLPVEAIIALQDQELHQRIRTEVAAPVGDWIAEQIYQGVSTDEVQARVKDKFIQYTVNLVARVKAERERAKVEVEERRVYKTDIAMNRWVDLVPNRDQITPRGGIVKDEPDQSVLARYSGSSGDSCGTWGRGNNQPTLVTIDGSGQPVVVKASSVNVLRWYFSGETKSKACITCGGPILCGGQRGICYKCA